MTCRAVRTPPDRAGRTHGVGRIRNYFLTGLIVAGPVAITVWLIWSFVTWVDDLVRPFIPVALPAGNLSAGQDPGLRPDHRVRRADAARLPHRQPRRPHAGRVRREAARAACRSCGRSTRPEAGLRDAVLEIRLELPQGRAGRISGARHVVAGVPLDSRRAPTSPRGCRQDEHVSVFMPCTPNPTTGFFFYVPRKRRDRARHPGRSGDDAADVGRHDRSRAAMAISRASSRRWPKLRARARAARASQSRRVGEVIYPARMQPDRFVALEQIEQVAQRLAALAT